MLAPWDWRYTHMINLLPPSEKAKRLSERTERLTIIIAGTILVALISLILILFALKTYIWGQAEFQKIALAQSQKDFETSELQELEEKIISTNLSFSQLKSFYGQKAYFSERIEEISLALPKTIYLYSLTLAYDKEELRVSLSGFSPSRETLLKLKENLEANPNFKEIYFPRSIWVELEDIDFIVNFSL